MGPVLAASTCRLGQSVMEELLKSCCGKCELRLKIIYNCMFNLVKKVPPQQLVSLASSVSHLFCFPLLLCPTSSVSMQARDLRTSVSSHHLLTSGLLVMQ